MGFFGSGTLVLLSADAAAVWAEQNPRSWHRHTRMRGSLDAGRGRSIFKFFLVETVRNFGSNLRSQPPKHRLQNAKPVAGTCTIYKIPYSQVTDALLLSVTFMRHLSVLIVVAVPDSYGSSLGFWRNQREHPIIPVAVPVSDEPSYTIDVKGVPLIDELGEPSAAHGKPWRFRPKKWLRRLFYEKEPEISGPKSNEEIQAWRASQAKRLSSQAPSTQCDPGRIFHLEYSTTRSVRTGADTKYPAVFDRCDRLSGNWNDLPRLVRIVDEAVAYLDEDDYDGKKNMIIKILDITHAVLGYWGREWWKEVTTPCTMQTVRDSRGILVNETMRGGSIEDIEEAFRHIGSCMVHWLKDDHGVTVGLKETKQRSQ